MKLDEVLSRWQTGRWVKSAELGGLGLEYEYAIQKNIFNLCDKIKDWEIYKFKITPTDQLWELINDKLDELLREICNGDGLSGAQAGVIKNIAHQFCYHGYNEMMSKLEDDRIIYVNNLGKVLTKNEFIKLNLKEWKILEKENV